MAGSVSDRPSSLQPYYFQFTPKAPSTAEGEKESENSGAEVPSESGYPSKWLFVLSLGGSTYHYPVLIAMGPKIESGRSNQKQF